MNILIKIFLILASIILLLLGGFSLYKILNKNTDKENVSIRTNPTATVNPQFIANNTLPTPIPTITLTPTINPPTPTIFLKETGITPTPTSIPSKIPTIKPSIAPTLSPIPTIFLTVKPSLSPTQSQKEKLPIAGNSIPTLILLALGLTLFVPFILL